MKKTQPKWNIEVWNEWKAIFNTKGYNWIGLTPIYIYFEWYRAWGQLEFTFVILGLGFYITYDLGDTKLRREIYKSMKGKIKKWGK